MCVCMCVRDYCVILHNNEQHILILYNNLHNITAKDCPNPWTLRNEKQVDGYTWTVLAHIYKDWPFQELICWFQHNKIHQSSSWEIESWNQTRPFVCLMMALNVRFSWWDMFWVYHCVSCQTRKPESDIWKGFSNSPYLNVQVSQCCQRV